MTTRTCRVPAAKETIFLMRFLWRPVSRSFVLAWIIQQRTFETRFATRSRCGGHRVRLPKQRPHLSKQASTGSAVLEPRAGKPVQRGKGRRWRAFVYLRSRSTMTYSINLNGPQLSAVKTTQGPLLILAGAGTGKTRVITSRIAYLLCEGVPASRILALTFTNKAAREMNARVNAIVNASDSRGLTISTFHALCVRILRQEAYRVGYKSNFSIYDESDSLSLIRKIIPKESGPGEKLEPSHVRTFISNAKNESWQFSRSGHDLFGDLFERYQEELKNCNAMDFDDLLCVTARLFTQCEQARTNWQRHFGFI